MNEIMNENRSDIAGVILAGGKSSRMGKDKALLNLDGMPFIQHVAKTLSSIFTKVIIVSDHSEPYRFLHLPVYPDVFKQCGPLAGIHSALHHTVEDSIFVLSCDLPLVTSDVVSLIVKHSLRSVSDAVVPRVGENIQPLCGVYKRTCSKITKQHLESRRYSVAHFLEDVNTIYIDLAPVDLLHGVHTFAPVNTLENYRILLNS